MNHYQISISNQVVSGQIIFQLKFSNEEVASSAVIAVYVIVSKLFER